MSKFQRGDLVKVDCTFGPREYFIGIVIWTSDIEPVCVVHDITTKNRFNNNVWHSNNKITLLSRKQ